MKTWLNKVRYSTPGQALAKKLRFLELCRKQRGIELNKQFQILFWIFVFLVYFAVGFYNINNVSLAGDESAHLGAASSYESGKGLNFEHPALLKTLNSIFLQLFLPDADSQTFNQWGRGVEILIFSPYSSKAILSISRSPYLIFNSLIFIVLIFYTYYFKYFKFQDSALLSIFILFSPSLASHNYLITFDVAAAITAFSVILSFVYFFKNYTTKPTRTQILLHSFVTSLAIFLAINVKFSNLVLLPIIAVCYLVLITKDILSLRFENLKILLFNLTVNFWSLILGIWFLNYFAYKNLASNNPISSIIFPFWYYIKGLMLTLGRSDDGFYNFIDGSLQKIHYWQFILRVFWFKENPIFVILFVLSLVALAWIVIKKLSFKKTFFNKYAEIALWIGFPLIYFGLAYNTRFTIGYRHFYPVLIFVYAAVARIVTIFGETFLANSRAYLQTKSVLILITLTTLIIFGFRAIPYNISYINFFWQASRWELIKDSTYNWDQGQQAGFEYLDDNSLVTSSQDLQSGLDWNLVIDTSKGANSDFYITSLIGQNYLENQYYPKGPYFNIREVKISSLDKDYLMIDSNALQYLSDEKESNQTAKENLDWLKSKEPVFNNQDLVFIYKIK